MITIRMTREGAEVTRFLPFIVFGNEGRGVSSLMNSPSPLLIEKEVKDGKYD